MDSSAVSDSNFRRSISGGEASLTVSTVFLMEAGGVHKGETPAENEEAKKTIDRWINLGKGL